MEDRDMGAMETSGEKVLSREEILEKLNDRQREAVTCVNGPLLILAGAGSGKTRVLVHRIAWLIGVEGVSPGKILAITFTNKAADEMRSRVDSMIGFRAGEIWVMTFHAFCVRVLRRHAEELGFNRYFSIYDTDDQLRLMKDIFRRRNISPRSMSEKTVLREISKQKNDYVTAAAFAAKNQRNTYYRTLAELFGEYQERLKEANAMDFDDLLVYTVDLLASRPEILELYQERFRYLLVDEYQDTNNVQFRLVRLLSERYRNLCVVGDDDQSIYKFRGADIKNILSFEETFPDARIVRLEQNYRSTQNILDAANAVIRNNGRRKAKRLWTDAGPGAKIRLRQVGDSLEEAAFVVGEIRQMVDSGKRRYRDFAVLYRTNAQSRAFEEQMIRKSVPYRLVGGINFYARKEIKDLLAYLKLIDNPADDISAQRIINVPKRGIGDTTVRVLSMTADEKKIPFYRAALLAGENRDLKAAAVKKLKGFTDLIEGFREEAKERGVDGLLNLVVDATGYREELESEDTDEANERIENIDELISKAVQYMKDAPEPSLSGFLEDVALIADIDTVDTELDRALLMTLHAAKGLEFPAVYLVGMEEGLFPSQMSIDSDEERKVEAIEEERRLCYVGITRAKEDLTLVRAYQRFFRGESKQMQLSRFVREIPRQLIDLGGKTSPTRPAIPEGGVSRELRDAITRKPNGMGTYSNPYIAKPKTPPFGKSFPANAGKAGGEADTRSGKGGYAEGGAGCLDSKAVSAEDFFSGSRAGAEGSSGSQAGKSGAGFSGARSGKAGEGISGETSGTDGRGAAAPAKDKSADPLGLGYAAGDKVRHVKFGVGTVLAVKDRGRDYEVTVDFPAWGTKKMYAAFAKLEPVNS